jgi:hypothetical protein
MPVPALSYRRSVEKLPVQRDSLYAKVWHRQEITYEILADGKPIGYVSCVSSHSAYRRYGRLEYGPKRRSNWHVRLSYAGCFRQWDIPYRRGSDDVLAEIRQWVERQTKN